MNKESSGDNRGEKYVDDIQLWCPLGCLACRSQREVDLGAIQRLVAPVAERATERGWHQLDVHQRGDRQQRRQDHEDHDDVHTPTGWRDLHPPVHAGADGDEVTVGFHQQHCQADKTEGLPEGQEEVALELRGLPRCTAVAGLGEVPRDEVQAGYGCDEERHHKHQIGERAHGKLLVHVRTSFLGQVNDVKAIAKTALL